MPALAGDTDLCVPVKANIARWLIALVRKQQPQGRWAMVEVGVKQGRLAAELLRADPKLTYMGVDRWSPAVPSDPYAVAGDPAALASQVDHDAWHKEAADRLRHWGERAILYHGDSRAAAAIVAKSSRQLVFLDADHTEQARYDDLYAWEPVVCCGGILAGGLWHSSFGGDGCERAVRRFQNERGWGVEVQRGPAHTWAICKP